jgi:prefoldin subunit 5
MIPSNASTSGHNDDKEDEEVEDLHGKISDYQQFLHRVISDRMAAQALLDVYEHDISSLDRLDADLTRLKTEGKADDACWVDLGADVQMKAELNDPSTIFISVGLGFHVECKVGVEASRIIAIRRGFFQAKAEEARATLERIQNHEALITEGLSQLQKLAV